MLFTKNHHNTNNKSYRGFSAFLSLLLLHGCQNYVEPLTQAPVDEQDMVIQARPAAQATLSKNKKPSVKPLPRNPISINPVKIDLSDKTTLSNNAWQEILDDPGIELKLNKRIRQQKSWYLKHPAFLSKVLQRAEPFLAYVIQEADKKQLPRALALLPIVESRYDPHAISKAGAVGTWQFMPATAQYFGLKMNWWFDGRRDIITSTDAALVYLSQLNQRFDDDWLLALASYNAGGGNVNKAIRKNSEKGLPTDYWSLNLPEETKQYVPRLLALLSIIADAQKYGVVLPKIDSAPAIIAVQTGGQINIATTAKQAGLSETQFRQLNPGLRRWASDPQGPHKVLVPRKAAPQFRQVIAALPKNRKINWHKHQVKPGDTISQIAKAYNIPTLEFKRVNKLSSSFIKVGQSLIVPGEYTQKTVKLSHKNAARAKTLTHKTLTHRVQQGDTLWDISRQYNTSIRSIAAQNNMPTRAPLKVGHTLKIDSDQSAQQVNYKVQAGDSLYGIARRFKVSIGEIATWNTLNKKNHITPGQKLTLYISDES